MRFTTDAANSPFLAKFSIGSFMLQGRSQFSSLILVVFLNGLIAPVRLAGQSTVEPIYILSISHEHEEVSIKWRGGFPPYRVRVNNGASPTWTELPDFINSNSFVASASSPASLFQIRTEFEPLRITGVYEDGDFVRLQWRGGIPPYRVEACDATETNWIEMPRLVLENYYASPFAGNSRLYRVRVETDTNAPSTPLNLSLLTAQCDRVVLGWTATDDPAPGSGLKGHNLYRDGQVVSQIPIAESFVLDTNLVSGRTYQYALTAIDRAGNESGRTLPVPVTTPQCPVAGTNAGVTLAWDPSEEPDVAGYIVHWGREPGVYLWQMDVMQATSTTFTDLESGVPYFFAVTAYDLGGSESEPSVTLAFIPPWPAGLDNRTQQ